MTTIRSAVVAAFSLVLSYSTSPAADRFVHELKLGDDFIAVVSEGDLEPASIGTYSIKLYKDLKTGAFITGITRERDGSLKSAGMADVNKDGKQEIVVVIEAAGEGGSVTTEAFTFKNGRLVFDNKLSGSAETKSPVENAIEELPVVKPTKEKPVVETKPVEPVPVVVEPKPATPAPVVEPKPVEPAPATETKPVVEPTPETIVPVVEEKKPVEEPKAPTVAPDIKTDEKSAAPAQ